MQGMHWLPMGGSGGRCPRPVPGCLMACSKLCVHSWLWFVAPTDSKLFFFLPARNALYLGQQF